MNSTTISAAMVERALAEACRRAHAEVLAFTVAPRAISGETPWDGHDWLIEFADPPRAPDLFPRALDETLCRLHAGYHSGRAVQGTIAPPRVIELPAGTFYRLRRAVPPIGRDRDLAEALLAVAGLGRVPPMVVGA